MKKEKKKNPTRKPKLIFLVGVVLLILSSVQLIISHNLATAGETVRQLELKNSQLEEENRILSDEISKMGSLARISSEAKRIGLIKTTQVVHLPSEVPVALR